MRKPHHIVSTLHSALLLSHTLAHIHIQQKRRNQSNVKGLMAATVTAAVGVAMMMVGYKLRAIWIDALSILNYMQLFPPSSFNSFAHQLKGIHSIKIIKRILIIIIRKAEWSEHQLSHFQKLRRSCVRGWGGGVPCTLYTRNVKMQTSDTHVKLLPKFSQSKWKTGNVKKWNNQVQFH